MAYKEKEIVYFWGFVYETAELKYDSCQVVRYDYLDGAQWTIIDEYLLSKKYIETKWGFIKTEKSNMLRMPGHLISNDIILAKLTFLYHFLEAFHYPSSLRSDEMHRMVNNAKNEYNYYIEKFPELIIKAAKPKLVDSQSFRYFDN